jgi:hypothetical protein
MPALLLVLNAKTVKKNFETFGGYSLRIHGLSKLFWKN